MNYNFNINKINVGVNCGALGDMICGIPILKVLLSENRINKILAAPLWKELFKLTGISDENIIWLNPKGLTPFDPGNLPFPAMYPENRAPYRTDLYDFFSQNVAYANLSPEEKSLYVDRNLLPINPLRERNYIVMQASPVWESRTLNPEAWNEIKNYLFDKGFEVVALGDMKRKAYDLTGCIIDYMDCSISQTISILHDAKCMIGVDGGLIYLAALTNCPIVAGYTFVNPRYRAPCRRGIEGWNFLAVEPRSECKYCSDSICAYGITFDKECPNKIDFECAKSLHAEDFIMAIESFSEIQENSRS